jgi:membrane-associated phospholipid phosphatase/predicted protein tyrosine phosphatase
MGDFYGVARPAGDAMNRFWKSAATSAALSALFLIVYGGCGWITSHRAQVGTFYFAWELRLPFVAAMILPYMSIDLLYIAAPFLAESDHARRTLAGRIILAILVAGLFFLLFPLKIGFAPPRVDGWLGLIFNNFRSVDRSFNAFPSLHVALWAILFDFYLRQSKGLLRGLVILWFSLMALSPILTYQHQVIDILGGLVLAVLCFHFIRDEPLRQHFLPNRRVGNYYLAAAILLAALAFARLPWTGLLFWPAFSLALVSAGYHFLGPGIFRKQNGRHLWTTSLLLGPVLIGQRLSLIHYARQCRAVDRLTDGLWIGRRLSMAAARQARADGITAVVDLTAEFSEPAPFRDLPYLQIPILDLTAPTPEQIDQAIAFIEQYADAGTVYLHCKVGYSRTAAVAGAYLLASGEADSVEQALTRLRQARPTLIARPEAVNALLNFRARRALQGSAFYVFDGNGSTNTSPLRPKY